MAPTLDIRFTIGAVTVADWNIGNFQMEVVGAEEQIKITKGVEVAEVRTIGCDAFIVFFEKRLGPAEGVLHRLTKRPAKGNTEKLVGAEVAKAHRLVFHRINQE